MYEISIWIREKSRILKQIGDTCHWLANLMANFPIYEQKSKPTGNDSGSSEIK